MSFTEAVSTVLSKYATFSGRATRSEFWWYALFLLVLFAITQLLDAAIFGPLLGFGGESGQPLTALVSIGLLLPNIAVAVRRMHDIGRTGWWVLIGLIPIIGFLLLLYWYVQPSEEGQNQYG